LFVGSLSNALRNKEVIKAFIILSDVWPFETAAVSFTLLAGAYAKLYAPWRHQHWPYTEKQVAMRARFHIPLTPPFATKRVFLPILFGGWALDKIRRAMKRNS